MEIEGLARQARDHQACSEFGGGCLLIAMTREVSPRFAECELTHLARQEINLGLARSQHHEYENALKEMGCRIRRLPVEPNMPDSVFIEDTAVVLDEAAIVTRMGAASRREEARSVASSLKNDRKIYHVVSPGTLEGGDVLKIEKTIYVGLSSRTNESGISQLKEFVTPYQYEVVSVPIERCLHLKSAVSHIGKDKLLINRSWVDPQQFGAMELIDVDPEEPYAANALLVGAELMYPINFPKTLRRLIRKGIAVREVDVSELQKAEGAVTCCSLIFIN